jgi:ketosteroid isomerase-like protein
LQQRRIIESTRVRQLVRPANPGDTTLVRARDPIWISLRGARPPSRRTVDEAFYVRVPAVFRALARLTLKLSRRSRLRQGVIRRSILQAMGAWMRGDFEFGVIRYAPDAVLAIGDSDRMRLDLEASYRGRDGVRVGIQTYQDAFGDWTYEPHWIVDLGGDVFVMLLHQSLRGRASGASVEQVSAHRVELRDGLIVREEVFFAPGHDWTSLAQAVGLDRAEMARRQSP